MEEKKNEQENASNGGMYRNEEQKKTAKSPSKALLAVCAVAIALVCFLAGWFGQMYSVDPRMRTLMWLVDTVDKKYYEEIDFDEYYNNLYDAAAPDIFSGYYSAEEYARLVEESQGSSSNFGIAISADEGDLMQIALVVGNSSAERAGIQVGMYIYRFGLSQNDLQSGSYEDMSRFVSGKAGQDIVFECGFTEDTKRCYTVRSEEYLASYCMYADRETTFRFRGEDTLSLEETGAGLGGLPSDTAYIRLFEFEGNASWEFSQCLLKMQERGKKNLVLDLRHNGGGYLTILQTLASYFTKNTDEANPVTATAKYRNGSTTVFRADGNYYNNFFDKDTRFTVLADEFSASASEALIGAMIDFGAITYGDIYLRKTEDGTAHSYGKGVMQSLYMSASGEAFRLTAAKIYWPSGKSIHGVGVTEGDGAHAVEAPSLPAKEDVFLETVLQRLPSAGVL